MLRILHIGLLFILVSCGLQNGAVKFVNKEGKVVYKTKQVPKFNQEYLNKHPNTNISNSAPIIINQNINNNDDNIIKLKQNNLNLIKNSTAYQSKSVIDNNQKINNVINENLEIRNKIIKDQEKLDKPKKTIEDFYYLPDSIFNDYTEDIKNNQNMLGLNNKQNNNTQNNTIDEDNDGFFSFFKNKDNKNEIKKDQEKELFNNINQVSTKEDLYQNQNSRTKINSNYSNQKDNIKTGAIINDNSAINYDAINQTQEVKEDSFFTKIGNFFKGDTNKDKKIEKYDNYYSNESYLEAELTNNKDDVILKAVEKPEVEKIININTQNNLQNRLEIGDIKTEENDIVSNKYKKQNTSINNNKKKIIANDGLEKGKYYVQFGSLLDKKKAQDLLNKYKNPKSNCQIITADLGNKGIRHKTLCGPFVSRAKADIEKERIINLGHYDVFIFKK